MNLPPELIVQLGNQGEQAINAFAELWKNRHSPIDQQINTVLSTQNQHSEQLTALLKQQQQLTNALTQEAQTAHPERAFLDYATSPDARLWLRNPDNTLVIEELNQQALSAAERSALFGNEGLFTALNQRAAKELTASQVLTLINTQGLRQRFAEPDFIKLFEQADFIKLFEQADFIKLFEQADFIKLFEQADFIKLFEQADFIQLFNQPRFMKALNPSQLLKHFADQRFTSTFNPSQQLAAWQHPQIIAWLNTAEGLTLLEQAAFVSLFNQSDFIKLLNQSEVIKLLNQSDFIKLLNQSEVIKLLNQPDFIKLFKQVDFVKALAETATLSKIDRTRRTNAAQFGHWPKLASTAKPILGYFSTGYHTQERNQRAAITAQFALALDTTSQSRIETAVQQGQINTLIHPIYSTALTSNACYRDFVALGGRLIVNLCGQIPEQFLNRSFGWALNHVKEYRLSERLNGSGFTGTTPTALQWTCCVGKGSLPAGAKVFLSLASNADQVAGFYVRYGLGEVIGIGYDWYKGSDAAWDALLRGLIQGTALSYQRRYGPQ